MVVLDEVLTGHARVFSGPDHHTGVAPIAVDRPGDRIAAGRIGLSRCLGHGSGAALLGLADQTLISANGLEFAGVRAKRLVGVVLIGLGLVALRRASDLGAGWCAATWTAAPLTPS